MPTSGLFETTPKKRRCDHQWRAEPRQHYCGIRYVRLKRYRYANNDMKQLEANLQQADEGCVEPSSIVQLMVLSPWTGIYVRT